MKKIVLPYIEELNRLKIEDAAVLLEEKGVEGAVDKLNWVELFPYRPITSFFIAYSKDALYLKYQVHGSMLKAVYENDQQPVYEDSCVSFFCKLPDEEFYYNFEFNCIGTCLAKKRVSRKDNVIPFTAEQFAKIERYSSIGKRAFKELEGIFRWGLTVKIPFEVLGIDGEKLPEKLLGNFYKCADGTGSPHYMSWSPIKTERPDFHRPEFFGEIIFGG
ncbi:hypothetical protein LJB95_03285 [Paludibacteraceae bacterium OttesenSCG-928-F17]|nr:hypothetical protein [Paludibacteraceae bacterium OttesenSCG-928-F17]